MNTGNRLMNINYVEIHYIPAKSASLPPIDKYRKYNHFNWI